MMSEKVNFVDTARRLFAGLAVIVLCNSCLTPAKKSQDSGPVILPDAPKQTEQVIQQVFPGARPAHDLSDSLIHYLNSKYGIESDKMLLGVSTCVDDIIYTKNFHSHPEIKGPFHLGGLAGLPFTGISGLDAFAHHIPDSGAMILLVEPHIGYSEKGGWGYVLRHDQHEPSTCCGALMGTLAKLKAGNLKANISEEDYQGGKIAEYTLEHQQSILASENPIIELTRVTSSVAESQIRAHVLDVSLDHVKFIVIITGVIINTDYAYTDYQYIDGISIYDVRKNKFVEEIKVR
jgi:hypothetical protein